MPMPAKEDEEQITPVCGVIQVAETFAKLAGFRPELVNVLGNVANLLLVKGLGYGAKGDSYHNFRGMENHSVYPIPAYVSAWLRIKDKVARIENLLSDNDEDAILKELQDIQGYLAIATHLLSEKMQQDQEKEMGASANKVRSSDVVSAPDIPAPKPMKFVSTISPSPSAIPDPVPDPVAYPVPDPAPAPRSRTGTVPFSP